MNNSFKSANASFVDVPIEEAVHRYETKITALTATEKPNQINLSQTDLENPPPSSEALS